MSNPTHRLSHYWRKRLRYRLTWRSWRGTPPPQCWDVLSKSEWRRRTAAVAELLRGRAAAGKAPVRRVSLWAPSPVDTRPPLAPSCEYRPDILVCAACGLRDLTEPHDCPQAETYWRIVGRRTADTGPEGGAS